MLDNDGVIIGSKAADQTSKEERNSDNPNGDPIRVPWRFDSDGNLIIKNPTCSAYFEHYTNKYGWQTVCELCARHTIVQHMKIHQHCSIWKNMRCTADNSTGSPTDSI